jgi:hypothetical protein
MIKLTLVILTTILSDTPDSLEQKACDYFFDNIFRQEYEDYKVIEFQNQTDTSKYCGIVHQCKNWDHKTKSQIMSSTPAKTVDVKANTPDIHASVILEILKDLDTGDVKINPYSEMIRQKNLEKN